MEDRRMTHHQRKGVPVPAIVRTWLKREYDWDGKGRVVPCQECYNSYERFCKRMGLKPTAHTVFGKLILQVFPALKRVKVSFRGKRIPYYEGIIPKNKGYDLEEICETSVEEHEREEALLLPYLPSPGPSSDDGDGEGDRAREVAKWMAAHFEATYYQLRLHCDVAQVFSLTRYMQAFADVCWSIFPVPWAIVKNNVIIDSIHGGETEGRALTFNVLCALMDGAQVVGDNWFAKKLFMYNLELLQDLHDCIDMNIVSALIHIMACNALMILPLEEGVKVAHSCIMIAETICEVTGSTDSELYFRTINFKYYLTQGESDVILPSEKCDPLEANHSAADYLRKDLAYIISARRLGSYVIGQTLYVQKLTSLFQKEKAKLLLAAPPSPSPSSDPSSSPSSPAMSTALVTISPSSQPQLLEATEQFRARFRELKKKGREIVQNIHGQIHRTAYLVHYCLLASATAEAYAELNNYHKAVKFIRQAIALTEEHRQSGSFFQFKQYPRILAEARAWTDMERFIRLATVHSEYTIPCMLRQAAQMYMQQGVGM